MLPVPARFAVAGFGLAVGACALVLGSEALRRRAPTTLTFKELNKGSTFAFVDNAPMSKTKGEPSASAGDRDRVHEPAHRRCRQADRAPLHATARPLSPRRQANRASFACEGVVVLGGGTLTVQALLRTPAPRCTAR